MRNQYHGKITYPLHIELILEFAPGTNKKPRSNAEAKSVKVYTLIDTGAAISGIREDIADHIGLLPIGETLIGSATHTGVLRNVFLIKVIFPGNKVFDNIEVVSLPRDTDGYFLLGMDILQHMCLWYNGIDGEFDLFTK